MDSRPGITILRVTGKNVARLFANEPGGHRWQRIPPTEKNGRVHTSTVTVAVMSEPTETQLHLVESDLEWLYCRGSGAGGQHRNVTDSAVQLKHVPTGVMVRCESERSKMQNRQVALSVLRARIWEIRENEASKGRAADRKAQVGSGMRGDKRRTIRVQDGIVTDHVLDKKWPLKQYLRGEW